MALWVIRQKKQRRALLNQNMPLLGICLGHQILAVALGGKTIKMKFGHHGANHPVRDTTHGRVLITSQNHGFAVDAKSLPASARVTYVSLFDGSLQGLACEAPPVITFQGHPEANPGPHDADFLFDNFMQLMGKHA
jgi:carbamoyl-phosphate synthase small subunit